MVDLGCRAVAVAGESDAAVQQTLSEMGVEYRVVPIARAGLTPLRDVGTLFSYIRLFRAESPRIFLGYTVKPVVYGSIAAWITRVPRRYALITGLGYPFNEGSGKRRWIALVVGTLYGLALRVTNKVFFQNPDDQALFRRLRILPRAIDSVVINGSGVDIQFFTPAPLPSGEISFLMIARLLGDKGVREYVRAAQEVRKKYPRVAFRLAGWIDKNPDAIRQEELDSWIRSATIEYLGRLEDVRPAIAGSSVYVLPSYREGTPRIVLEAMAMGRAIVTADAPGCRETVVNGENGFLVQVKSVDDLVRAIERFILDPGLAVKMGKRSREIAEERYDVRKVNAVVLREMGLA
jgi:glycosyltransferase involved in cell wall biosynthesis